MSGSETLRNTSASKAVLSRFSSAEISVFNRVSSALLISSSLRRILLKIKPEKDCSANLMKRFSGVSSVSALLWCEMRSGREAMIFASGWLGGERHTPWRTRKLAKCSGIGLEASPHIVNGFFRTQRGVGGVNAAGHRRTGASQAGRAKKRGLAQRVRRPAWVRRHAHGRGRAQFHEQDHASPGNVFKHEPVVAAIRNFTRAYFQCSATGDFTCHVTRHQSQPPGIKASGYAAAVS